MTRILVVDYSRSGNTHKVARAIADVCGADLEQIRDAQPRKGLGGWIRSAWEAMRKVAGEIRPPQRDPADYDLLVLGSPVWAGHVASPVRAFLRQRSGKIGRIALFVTEGGSGGPKALGEMSALARQDPLATMEVRAKDLGANLRSMVENFVERIGQGSARAAAPQRSRP